MTSQIKTVLLLGFMSCILILLGGMLGGRAGLVVALAIALGMNFFSYWYSDKIVLSMYKARELALSDAPGLHHMVEDLSAKAGIPKPRIMLIPQPAPNAFATGRNPEHGVVAVTQGIMQALSPDELKGVLAHEIGHIANRDILIQSIAAVLATAVMFIANIVKWGTLFGFGRDDDNGGNPIAALALAIVAPIAAMLIQMAISRSREFQADASGARFAGNPRHLAGALAKLDAYAKQVPMKANPATENMFIVSPFAGGNMANWFSTHPPTEERIRRLNEMAGRS